MEYKKMHSNDMQKFGAGAVLRTVSGVAKKNQSQTNPKLGPSRQGRKKSIVCFCLYVLPDFPTTRRPRSTVWGAIMSPQEMFLRPGTYKAGKNKDRPRK